MSTDLRLRKRKPKLPLDTTFDKILAYYIEGKKLTAKQEEQRKRYEVAYDLMCNYHSPRDVVLMLQEKFGISRRAAYRDVRAANDLFGNIAATTKEGTRNILFEYAMKTFQMAANHKDIQEMNRAIANMIKLKGLDKEDPDLPNFSDLVPTQQVIQLSPEFLEKYKDKLDPAVLKLMKSQIEGEVFDQYKETMAEDVPFVEVKDG